jgi:hypothetical protein
MKPHRKIQLAIIAIVTAYIAFQCIPAKAEEAEIQMTACIVKPDSPEGTCKNTFDEIKAETIGGFEDIEPSSGPTVADQVTVIDDTEIFE